MKHRGWQIDADYGCISVAHTWSATHPDYDASYEGEEDGWVGSHEVLYAATEKELFEKIDTWVEFGE